MSDEGSPRLCCRKPFPDGWVFFGRMNYFVMFCKALLGLGKGKESVAEKRCQILSRNFHLVPLANGRSGFVSSVHLESSALS